MTDVRLKGTLGTFSSVHDSYLATDQCYLVIPVPRQAVTLCQSVSSVKYWDFGLGPWIKRFQRRILVGCDILVKNVAAFCPCPKKSA